MSKTSIDWLPGRRLNDCRSHGATMGTRYSARFLAPPEVDLRRIAADLERAVTEVDRQMSNWQPGSDLSRLNRAAPGQWVGIAAHLVTVLVRGMAIGHDTGNAFNLGVGDLVSAWGFGPNPAPQPPADAEAHAPCRPVDEWLEVDPAGGRARRQAPVALDLCGIAKGFGVDELARVLDRHGIEAWLVGIDGELRSRGCKADGSPWSIALEAPDETRRSAMAVVELGDAAIATSGDYRHRRCIGGERVSHTMDPRAGSPLRGGLASVTVVAAACIDADAYATALMVLGEADGPALAHRQGLDALFIARAGDGLRTSGTGCFAGE